MAEVPAVKFHDLELDDRILKVCRRSLWQVNLLCHVRIFDL